MSDFFASTDSQVYTGPVLKQPRLSPRIELGTLKSKVLEAIGLARTYGARGLSMRCLGLVYRHLVRPCLVPVCFVHYAGIPVGYTRKWGDEFVPNSFLPEHVLDAPDYEAALVEGIKAHVREGDHIVVVGGGVGVTATISAIKSGPQGSVTCFEAASESTAMVQRTASLNSVSERIAIVHAVVGESLCSYGRLPNHDFVDPKDLPICDVLELDCEGAELDILRSMVIRPRLILVETHGNFGSTSSEVTAVLRQRGYSVECLGIAEPRARPFCEKNDIRVLIGFFGGRQRQP